MCVFHNRSIDYVPCRMCKKKKCICFCMHYKDRRESLAYAVAHVCVLYRLFSSAYVFSIDCSLLYVCSL